MLLKKIVEIINLFKPVYILDGRIWKSRKPIRKGGIYSHECPKSSTYR